MEALLYVEEQFRKAAVKLNYEDTQLSNNFEGLKTTGSSSWIHISRRQCRGGEQQVLQAWQVLPSEHQNQMERLLQLANKLPFHKLSSSDSSLVDESESSTHLGDDDSFEQLAQLDSFEDNISDAELQD